jgi:hypothetical protein
VGRVVVTEFISLDGVIQAPGDPHEFERGGWAQGGGHESMKFKFGETSETKRLDLVDSKPLEDGVFILTYRPSRNGGASAG